MGCGGIYAYELIRTIKGQARSEGAAVDKAQRALARAVASDADMQPCPCCRIYQPDMIGQQRARTHLKVLWIAFAALVVILILFATDVLQANTATMAATQWFADSAQRDVISRPT